MMAEPIKIQYRPEMDSFVVSFDDETTKEYDAYEVGRRTDLKDIVVNCRPIVAQEPSHG